LLVCVIVVFPKETTRGEKPQTALRSDEPNAVSPPAVQINLDAIPRYLVLRAGCAPYVLDADRRVLRREASRLLRMLARTRGAPISIADDAWNDFSGTESISPAERAKIRAYALVNGAESEYPLRLLAGL
jgi:hypothetical protein